MKNRLSATPEYNYSQNEEIPSVKLNGSCHHTGGQQILRLFHVKHFVLEILKE